MKYLILIYFSFLSSQSLLAQKRYLDYVFEIDEIEEVQDVVYLTLERNSYLVSSVKDASWLQNWRKKSERLSKILDKGIYKKLETDIYLPENDKIKKRPLIIFIHGGGFVLGTKRDNSIVKLCKEFSRKGYVTASINYRMVSLRYPSVLKAGYMATQDTKSAIRYFKNNAEKYGIDVNKVFVGGISAGGTTALHTAFLDDHEEMAGRYNKFEDLLGCLDCPEVDSDFDSSINGVINISGGLINLSIINERIPVISFHGTNDSIIVIDHDLPFKPFMEDYNALIKSTESLINELGSAIKSKSYESGIGDAQMEKMYGSRGFHSTLEKKNIPNKLLVFEGHDHNLILSDGIHGKQKTTCPVVLEEITLFLYKHL